MYNPNHILKIISNNDVRETRRKQEQPKNNIIKKHLYDISYK